MIMRHCDFKTPTSIPAHESPNDSRKAIIDITFTGRVKAEINSLHIINDASARETLEKLHCAPKPVRLLQLIYVQIKHDRLGQRTHFDKRSDKPTNETFRNDLCAGAARSRYSRSCGGLQDDKFFLIRRTINCSCDAIGAKSLHIID